MHKIPKAIYQTPKQLAERIEACEAEAAELPPDRSGNQFRKISRSCACISRRSSGLNPRVEAGALRNVCRLVRLRQL
jgi:hypothetical protein